MVGEMAMTKMIVAGMRNGYRQRHRRGFAGGDMGGLARKVSAQG